MPFACYSALDKRQTLCALAVLATTALTAPASASEFPSAIDLASLDGKTGFRLDGIDAGDWSGFSVSTAGDVNSDGFGDILIGALSADPGGKLGAGESYLVFGKAVGFAATLDVAALNGTNGFRIDGIDNYDFSGFSVSSAGDVNGDGFADMMVGAPGADPEGVTYAGESYLVYGKTSGFAEALDLGALNGINGVRLDGVNSGDESGFSVSTAGDVNGDGFVDFLIGANEGRPGAGYFGETYVVFGRASGFASSVDLATLDGNIGFRLGGIDAGDQSGHSVSAAGDINDDGFGDILIGAHGGDAKGSTNAGETYVVFGKASGFTATFDLRTLDGTNGFRLDGRNAGDQSGFSVSTAGDVNGDGFGDILIGALGRFVSGWTFAGESYVVFGKGASSGGFEAVIDLSTLDGSNGFRLEGFETVYFGGISVSAASDVNGDGFGDIMIGARFSDPGGKLGAGESYLVFGKAVGFAATLDVAALNGTNGFRIDGIDNYDFSGFSVSSAGDVNGDGFGDLLIGAPLGDGDGETDAGESYVVFGRAPDSPVTRTGSAASQYISGGRFADTLFGLDGDDRLEGRKGADRLDGSFAAIPPAMPMPPRESWQASPMPSAISAKPQAIAIIPSRTWRARGTPTGWLATALPTRCGALPETIPCSAAADMIG